MMIRGSSVATSSATAGNFSEGLREVDGVNMKISSSRMTFLILLKTLETDEKRKTLNIMLTDSADNFWIGDFD